MKLAHISFACLAASLALACSSPEPTDIPKYPYPKESELRRLPCGDALAASGTTIADIGYALEAMPTLSEDGRLGVFDTHNGAVFVTAMEVLDDDWSRQDPPEYRASAEAMKSMGSFEFFKRAFLGPDTESFRYLAFIVTDHPNLNALRDPEGSVLDAEIIDAGQGFSWLEERAFTDDHAIYAAAYYFQASAFDDAPRAAPALPAGVSMADILSDYGFEAAAACELGL